MDNLSNVVMSTLKGSNEYINVIPTKETIDFNRIYLFNKNPNFGLFDANREINKTKVKEIKNTIENGEYHSKYLCPIRVDIDTFKITDGQHRNAAFIGAWENGSKEYMRVLFEELPKESESEKIKVIIDINSTQGNWSNKNYERSRRVQGDEAMKIIQEFGEAHELTQKIKSNGKVTYYPRYVYALLFGRNITKEIKQHQPINISREDIEFGAKIHDELLKIVNALGYEKSSWFESFASAYYDIRKNDVVYTRIIDKIGIDYIISNIGRYFAGFHIVTRKSEWTQRFRSAFADMDDRIVKNI